MASEPKGDIRILEQALREATDHGRGAVKVYRAEATLALAELSAAREMREVLKEIEWTQHRCPLCDGWEQTPEDRERGTGGHAPDCRLARLIGGGE